MHAATSKIDNYERFLRGIQLRLLALRDCSAKIDRDTYWKVIEAQAPAAPWLSAEYTLGKVEKLSFGVVADLGLTVEAGRSAGEAPPVALALRAVYDVRFDCDRPAGKHAARFAGNDLRLLIWPYFRELVSNLTARMGIPPMLIPLTGDDGHDHTETR